MARTYARIDVHRGQDDDWRALTLEEQAVYDFLVTHPKLSICGALDVKMSVWVRQARDLTTERLEQLLAALENAKYILWDRDTDELAIRTFVTHDKVLQNKNLGRGMWSAWATIESEELRFFLVDNFPETAWEPRFQPPISDPRNHRSNDGSNHRYERRFEPPHPQPQPQLQPASADRSNAGYEFTTPEGQAPEVRPLNSPPAA